MATIHTPPNTTLADETVNIKLSGFDPGSKVTVRSYLPEPGMKFEAHGHFVVDGHGEVRLMETPSSGGTYTGVEPMGLFWSMIQCPGQRPGLRYFNRDVTKPMVITLSVHRGHIDMSELQTDIPIVTKQMRRSYMAENVEIIKVHSGRVRGKVFKPKGPGPFRGVIDMFGSAGGLIEFRAALLASRGFAAYALPYFRYEDLPEGLEDMDLDYFEEATDWFHNQDYVIPGGVGVVGVSWGAEMAALMASTFPQKISACVSISGSCVRTSIPMTYKGKSLPHLGLNWSGIKIVQKGNPEILNIFDVLDPLETAPEEALLKLERAQRILFIVGLDDINWPTPFYIDGAERRLKALGCDNYEILRYPGAGHIIEPPYAPLTITSWHGTLGGVLQWGGRPREHQRGQEDAWPNILNFLNKYVGTQPTRRVTSKL